MSSLQHSSMSLHVSSSNPEHISRPSGTITQHHAIAQRPGDLIYLTARNLSGETTTMAPFLLCAMDACTYLQIGRFYMTQTSASVTDFLDFIISKFPFSITEVRTRPDLLFHNPRVAQFEHRFTAYAALRGIRHTLLAGSFSDEVCQMMEEDAFRSFDISRPDDSSRGLFRALVRFLHFHNNYSSFPSLQGKTPIQKIRSFAGFDHIVHFDPYEDLSSSRSASRLSA